jgi:hypothetical protein
MHQNIAHRLGPEKKWKCWASTAQIQANETNVLGKTECSFQCFLDFPRFFSFSPVDAARGGAAHVEVRL